MSQKTDREILGYSRWLVLIVAFLAMALISPYQYAWSSISPFLSDRFGWTLSRVEAIYTLYMIFQAGASVPAGVLRDRYGPRLLTMIAGVVAAVGLYALTASSPNIISVAFGVFGGFAVGVIYSNAVNTANKWFPDKRGVTAGLIAGAFSWGSIPFIFWIRGSATAITYPQIIGEIALIAGPIIVVAGYFLKDPPKGWAPLGWIPTKKRVKRPCEHQFTLKETVRTWQLWVLFVSFCLVSGAGLMTVSKIVRYAEGIGFTAVVATAAAGGLCFTNGLGRPVMGWVSDRLGRENTMILSFVLAGILTIGIHAFGVINSPIGFLVCTLGALFFWGPLYALFPAVCGHYYGEDYAASNYGVLYTAKLVGGLYGGYLSALIIMRYGFGTSFIIGAIMQIVAGLIIIIPKYRPPVWKSSAQLRIG
ncbi:MAG TPA: OFA family MFS transporter [Dehalococcoidia bacterium]|nr:OFA family MFS transporter [Dehalococcoidia bacterium]